MRVSAASIAVACLSVCSLSSASTVAPASGVCGLTVTCAQQTSTTAAPACSANAAADFKLVASALQGCKDVSYYFLQGQTWPINDKPLFCNVGSVCGKLVPYLRSAAYLAEDAELCESFVPFADTIATFRDFCRGEPVQEISGDNGLLRDLKAGNATTKPTPAPTNNNDYRSEPIPTQAGLRTSRAAPTMASTVLATLAVAVAVATMVV